MLVIKFIILAIIAFLPSLFWLWFFVRYDWKNPEPPKIIIKVFGLAASFGLVVIALRYLGVVSFLSGIFPYDWMSQLFYIFILVAFVEEGLKFLAIKIGAYHNKAYDEYLDGIIYGITAGLGLAVFENFMAIFLGGSEAIFFRFATSTLMHALVGGIMGYFMAISKFGRKKKGYFAYGLIVAVILHGGYNLVLKIPGTIGLISFCAMLIAMFTSLMFLINKTRNKK